MGKEFGVIIERGLEGSIRPYLRKFEALNYYPQTSTYSVITQITQPRMKNVLPKIAAQELVSTTRFTPPMVFAHAFSTFLVPSTAGPITSISSLGFSAGKGDAT